MLLMGDEVRRSQGGNNNTWCQNNPLGWMHWLPDEGDQALRLFVRRLLVLRRNLVDLINPELPLPDCWPEPQEGGLQRWRQWHGVEIAKPDWASWSHTVAWSINDSIDGPLLWCAMNGYSKAVHFDLPVATSGWLRVIDTALPAGDDLPGHPQPWKPGGIPLESRSLVLLVARRRMAGLQLP